jgi:hypothetical protein
VGKRERSDQDDRNRQQGQRGGAAVEIEHRLAALEDADPLNLADVHLPVYRVGPLPQC